MADTTDARKRFLTEAERSESTVIKTIRVPRSWWKKLEAAGGFTELVMPYLAGLVGEKNTRGDIVGDDCDRGTRQT